MICARAPHAVFACWQCRPVFLMLGPRMNSGPKTMTAPFHFLPRAALLALLLVMLHPQAVVAASGLFFPRGTNLTALYSISESYVNTDALRMLMASLQGLAARQSTTQFIVTGGSYSTWRDHLRDRFGIPTTSVTDPWVLVDRFKGFTGGYVLFDLAAPNSINAATSLTGPLRAVAVDRSLESTVRAHGITNLIADVSARDEAWVRTTYPGVFNGQVVIEQRESLCLHLRDYAAMVSAFTFFDGNSAFRTSVMSGLDPDAAALGWGDASSGEEVFVGDGSDRGVFMVAADYARNLSTLSSAAVPMPRQHTRVLPVTETNVHYAAFLVTDGDNVQWDLGGFFDYYNHPARGSFNMGWALSPSLADLAPSVLHWYFDNASNGVGRDFFVSGPSGIGYMYPSRYPAAELDLHAQRLSQLAGFADLGIVQILDFNAFNRLDLWSKYTAQPSLDAVIYLEYSRYDNPAGAVLWSNGKPVLSARKMLWGGLAGEDEATVINTLNTAARDPYRAAGYSLVVVHVWSQTLSNVLNVVNGLAPDVRVVTPDTLVRLMKTNIAGLRGFDFAGGAQGWTGGTSGKPFDRANWTGGTLQLDGSDLGAPDANPNSWFTRPLTLPTNAATLRFDTRADNDGLLRVRLRLADGAFAPLLDWSALPDHNWHTLSVSLAAYAGRDVTLYFEQNDGGQGSGEYRYVDNVVIETADTPAANLASIPLVSQGAVWKYRDNGTAPPANWRDLSFNDSAWAAGPARLGYGGDGEATTVSFGPNSAAKYITTWFRHSFVVNDAAACRALLLRVTRDDGVIVYLNGTEAWRDNLTSGTVTTGTTALNAIANADELIFYPVDLSGSLLRDGTNVLAVEMHQSSGGSSDLGLDLELTGEFVMPTPLVAAGSAWKYRDSGVDPGPEWRTPGFNDALWFSGSARLGYGGDGEATRLSYGTDANNKYITSWFRRSFVVPDPARFGNLRLRLLRDDGAVVYLNGNEVFRSNLTNGTITATTLAAVAVEGADEQRFVTANLSPQLLLAGTNLLAVEVHQAAANSPDLGFDLELVGEHIPLTATRAGTNLLVSWPAPAPGYRLETRADAASTNAWTDVTNAPLRAGALETVSLAPTSASGFFRLNQEVVDASTIWHKHLLGYQGWFATTNDGSPQKSWIHWFRNNAAWATNATVDFWPDISELDPDELTATAMTLPGGAPARLYGAYKPKTVLRHFKWMRDAGIDGVMLQRFSSELGNTALCAWRNQVACNVRAGAEAYGRVFNIMYDISGQNETTLVTDLQNDWNYLVNTLRLTGSARYLRHKGKPVVTIWGLGFSDRIGTAAQAQQLITWFKAAGVTVMGGVPTNWRTLTSDSKTNAEWATVYRSFDILSPWSVGRYSSDTGADNFRANYIAPDLADCAARGIVYIPVVWPGFSWKNLNGGALNAIPRNGGRFYWRQVYNAIAAGAPALYGAMFDEVDEGTAMFKLAPTSAQLPAQGTFVPLNIDGETLPSDWYLRLAGEATRMLRGERPLSATRPINP